MKVNWPDRIKIAMLGIILVPFIALVMFLMLSFSGIFTTITMKQGAVISIVVGIIIDILYTSRKWKKLKQDEVAGYIPDETNQNNISLPRTIVSIVVLVLAVIAYINYSLYSIAIAKILLLVCILVSAAEIVYLKTKR